MARITRLTTAEQYFNLSNEDRLQMLYAAVLLLIQERAQTQEATLAILELMANKLSVEEKQKLINMELGPEPIPAIQRKIEELQHELDEDLRNGVYNSGL